MAWRSAASIADFTSSLPFMPAAAKPEEAADPDPSPSPEPEAVNFFLSFSTAESRLRNESAKDLHSLLRQLIGDLLESDAELL